MKNLEFLFEQIENTDLQKRLFVQIGSQSFTYGDLLERAKKATTFFQQFALVPGDRIILAMEESWTGIWLLLAAMRNGLTPVFLNPDMGQQRARQVFDLIEPKLLFHEAFLAEKWELGAYPFPQVPIQEQAKKKGKLFKKLLKKQETPEADTSFPALIDTLSESPFPPAIDPEQTAYITLTSGSTGLPKAVELSYHSVFYHLETLSTVYAFGASSRLLNILRFYQADGVVHGPLLAFYQQAALFRPFHFELNKIGLLFSSIYKYRITHFVTVPTMLNLMYQYSEGYEDSFAVPEFQYIISLAAQLEQTLWQQFESRFGVEIINSYGLSETVTGSLFATPVNQSKKIGTLGKPVDCELRIVDEAGSLVRTGQTGEIQLRGEHLMKGYLKDPERTAAVLVDGWLHTGDLAYIDEEGFVVLNGRKKELVISGGVNIFPNEVNQVLNEHPAVLESASFGLEDPVFGERLVAAVVLKKTGSISEKALIEHCRQELEPAKVPHEVRFFEQFPKTISEKVQLPELKARWQEASQSASTADTSLTAKLYQAAAEAFKVDSTQLRPEDTPQTVEGWDSMNHLQFIVGLEAAFKVRFSTAEVMSIDSLKSAETILQSKLQH